MRSDDETATVIGIGSLVLLAVAGLSTLFLWGCPKYRVYDREMTGKAELAQAQANRQIKIAEAESAQEASKHLAQAEIERAKGVAEANKIIGESLKGNEDYLRYLWIHNLETAQEKGAQVIYVPTEANLPILEATRFQK
jgi:hypothetical protein